MGVQVMADGSMQRTLVNLFNEAATWEDQPNMRRKAVRIACFELKSQSSMCMSVRVARAGQVS